MLAELKMFTETWVIPTQRAVNSQSAWFIWQLSSMPPAGDLLAILKQYGIDRVAIKVLDGAGKYNVPNGDKPLIAYIETLKAGGIVVEAWGYHYPVNPGPQGDAIDERRQKLGFTAYHVNCEKEWQAAYGMPAAMKTLLGKLKVGGFTATMCSYRFPSQHPEFPWDAAMNHDATDAATPQVYFALAHNPEEQLQQTFQEYAKWGKPVYPVGPAFGATFGGTYWEPTPEELTRFRLWCNNANVPVIYWWSLDWVLRHKRYDLIEAATGHNQTTPPPPPVVELPPARVPLYQVRITAATLLNVRAQPTTAGADIGDLRRDSIVPVYGQFDVWLDVGAGWVHKDYTQRI